MGTLLRQAEGDRVGRLQVAYLTREHGQRERFPAPYQRHVCRFKLELPGAIFEPPGC